MAIYAPKGTVLLLCLLVLTAPDLRAAFRSLPGYRANWAVRCLAAFLLWGGVSAAWAPEPVAALAAAGRLSLLSLLGLVCVAAMAEAGARGRRPLRLGMAGAAVLLTALLGIEYLSDGALANLVKPGDNGGLDFAGPGTAILALVVFPAAAVGARRTRRPWSIPVAAAAVALVLAPLPMFAGLTAVLVGIGVFVATWCWRAGSLYVVVAAASLAIMGGPIIVKNIMSLNSFKEKVVQMPTSWQHRLGIWEYVSRAALERPVLGHGFDSSRVLGRNPPTVTVTGPAGASEETALPLHPHSLALQLWLELGLVGVAVGIGVLWSIARAAVRAAPDRVVLAGMAATLTAAMVIASVSYGAWQSWWVATLWLCAAALALGAKVPSRDRA